ncbi:MAG: hypothetical protein AAGF92_24100 [Myxococcota bacterium]
MEQFRRALAPLLLGALLVMCGDSSAQDEQILEGQEYFTGTYAGGFACDLTVDGKPDVDFLEAEMGIIQRRSGEIDLAMSFQFPDTDPDTSLFSGRAIADPVSGDLSGYFERCDGTFGAAEIARILPARTTDTPFAFNAETVFFSANAPTRDGELTTATCRFVFTRTNLDIPSIDTCEE